MRGVSPSCAPTTRDGRPIVTYSRCSPLLGQHFEHLFAAGDLKVRVTLSAKIPSLFFAAWHSAVGERLSQSPATLPPSRDTAQAMSQENVDRFVDSSRQSIALTSGRTLVHGSRDPLRSPGHGVARGLHRTRGCRGAFADFTEHFESVQIRCPDVRDLGDRVLALGTTQAIGIGSGVETELPFTVVAGFRDGRITHFTDFGDRADALEAAGLSE